MNSTDTTTAAQLHIVRTYSMAARLSSGFDTLAVRVMRIRQAIR